MKKNKLTTELEENIVRGVYRFEEKKTVIWFLKYVLLFAVLGMALFLVTIFTWELFKIQGTTDLLQLFSEDYTVIRDNFWDVLFIFYSETPIYVITALFILITAGSVSLLLFIRKLPAIRRKTAAILRYLLR